MRLFRVMSSTAGEKGFGDGPWCEVGQEDTLEAATALAAAEYAKGWRFVEVRAMPDEAEALRVEAERLRVDLDFYKKLATALGRRT